MVHFLDHPQRNTPSQPGAVSQPGASSSQPGSASRMASMGAGSAPGVGTINSATGGPQAANDAAELQATLERLANTVAALMSVSIVSLSLLDQTTGRLTPWVTLDDGGLSARPTRPSPSADVEMWVASHLLPVSLRNLSDPDALRQFPSLAALPASAGSLLCLPLIDARHILGALTVISPQPDAFDDGRTQLLQVFSEMAALAVSKTIQSEAHASQARELSALLDASRALTSSLDASQVFTHIVGSIRKVIACDDAVIYVYDERANALRAVAGMGPRGDRLGGKRVPLNDPHSIAAWVASNRRARLSSPGYGEVGPVTELFLSGENLSLLCVPLISKNSLRGVIMLARMQAFRPGELGVALNLSNIIAATLENVELYQHEQAEREQQAAIFASASDCFALVDGALTLIEVNGAFARLIGQPREQLIGQSCNEVLRQRVSGDCPLCDGERYIERALREGMAFDHIECQFEQPHQFVRRTGAPRQRKRSIDFSVTPVMGPEGPRALLAGHDITAIREVDEMKSNFLSMVSHELRGPLQTLNGYLDLLIDDTGQETPEQRQDFLRRARAGSERLTALVDDLLLISRRDAGQFALMREPVDLAPTIRETMEELELTAQDAEVRLVVDVPPSLPLVLADAPRIGQVARNLVANAIKFTPEGGEVRISAQATPTQVILQVRDTGIGIPQEHLPRIFDRFYQVGEATSRGKPHGQGLGLAIVRIIVEGHDGALHVESTPRQGSAFTVALNRLTGEE